MNSDTLNGQVTKDGVLEEAVDTWMKSWVPFYWHRLTLFPRVVPAVAQPLADARASTSSSVPDSSTKHDSIDCISGQFLFCQDHDFIKSEENLRFRHLVPRFVPNGVCATTHGHGTASMVYDVTINRPRYTNVIANLGFHSQRSLAMNLHFDDLPLHEWYYENTYRWYHETRRNYPFRKTKGHENFDVMYFCFGHMDLTVKGKMAGSVQ